MNHAEESPIIKLTSKNVEKVLSKYEYLYILFKGPKSSKCGTPVASFYQSARSFKETIPTLQCAEVDCAKQIELAQRFGTPNNHYHSTRLLVKGETTDLESSLIEDIAKLIKIIESKKGM